MAQNQRDRISSTTEIVATASGVVVGGGAGAAIAIAAGTSVPVLSTVASWVGLTLVAATPVGWVIGATVLGAAVCGGATYGVAKLCQHNGKIEALQQVDEEARIAEEEQKQIMDAKEVLRRKEDFGNLGFRCIEPAPMNLPDGSKAEVVAYGYQLPKEKREKTTNNPASRIYSVRFDGQERRLFDEISLLEKYGEAFTNLK